jgi:hypothetical protein
LIAGRQIVGQTANILSFLGSRLGLAPRDAAGKLWTQQLQLTIMDFVAEIHDTHHPLGNGLYYDEVREGVVSLPHGHGHAALGAFQKVAAAHAGSSANDWTDDADVEGVVGQSILNGIPVQLHPLSGP